MAIINTIVPYLDLYTCVSNNPSNYLSSYFKSNSLFIHVIGYYLEFTGCK